MTRLDKTILGAALLSPLVLSFIVFPTYSVDTIESVIWGRALPLLATPKHPPLMTWLGAVADRLPFADGWSAVLVQTAWDLIAIAFLTRLGRLVLPPERQIYLVPALVLSLVFVFWTLSGYALNADLAQVPFWAGIFLFAVQARRAPASPGNWIGLGLMFGGAALAKYMIILAAPGFVAATLLVPQYRALWRGYGPWLALALALLLVAPHAYALLADPALARYALGAVGTRPDWSPMPLLLLASGLVIMTVPYLSALAVHSIIGRRAAAFSLASLEDDADRRFVVLSFALMLALLALYAVSGHNFLVRFDAPLAGPFVIVSLLILQPDPARQMYLHHKAMLTAVIAYGLTMIIAPVLYVGFTNHRYLQEPADAVAQELQRRWDSAFDCGPAYVVGQRRPAQSVAVYFPRRILGFPLDNRDITPWYDPEKARRLGVIAVSWDNPDSIRASVPVPDDIAFTDLTVPLRRTLSGAKLTYHYAFVPPQSCPDK